MPVIGIADGRDPVVATPYEQHRRSQPMQAAAQSTFCDRPGELGRASDGPHPRRDHRGSDVRIARQREHRLGGLAGRILEQKRGEFFRWGRHPVGNRELLSPQANGIEQNNLGRQVRKRRGKFRCDHSAEGLTDQHGLADAQRANGFLVHQHHVGQLVDRVDGVWVADARAGELRRVHRVVLRQIGKEGVPREPPGWMQIDQPRSLSGDFHPHLDAPAPHGDCLLVDLRTGRVCRRHVVVSS